MSDKKIDRKKLNEVLKTKTGNNKAGQVNEQKRSYSQKAINVTKPPQSLLDRVSSKPKDKK